MNNIYFERLNNRYRGPFEKEKFAFLVNEIDKNLNFLYVKLNKQRASILALNNLSENTDISLDLNGNSTLENDSTDLSGQKVFDTKFRSDLKGLGLKVTKESVRDMVKKTTDYLDDVINTMDEGSI